MWEGDFPEMPSFKLLSIVVENHVWLMDSPMISGPSKIADIGPLVNGTLVVLCHDGMCEGTKKGPRNNAKG